MAVKRFRTRNGGQVRVVLPSGKVTLIGGEWKELLEEFHAGAYSAGCISEDMLMNKELEAAQDAGVLDKLAEQADYKERVRAVLLKAIEENNLKAFNKKGEPTVKYLREAMGETVPNHVKDEVWFSMLEEGIEPLIKHVDVLMSDITDDINGASN